MQKRAQILSVWVHFHKRECQVKKRNQSCPYSQGAFLLGHCRLPRLELPAEAGARPCFWKLQLYIELEASTGMLGVVVFPSRTCSRLLC